MYALEQPAWNIEGTTPQQLPRDGVFEDEHGIIDILIVESNDRLAQDLSMSVRNNIGDIDIHLTDNSARAQQVLHDIVPEVIVVGSSSVGEVGVRALRRVSQLMNSTMIVVTELDDWPLWWWKQPDGIIHVVLSLTDRTCIQQLSNVIETVIYQDAFFDQPPGYSSLPNSFRYH